MNFKTIICTAMFSMAFAAPVFADDSIQVVSFSEESSEDVSIELTGSKVITDDFSFKLPKKSSLPLVMVQEGDSYNLYDRAAYEEDGSGLLFSIITFEDMDYRVLEDCTILGFCGNETYVLLPYYSDLYEDPESAEFQACEDAFDSIRGSFVSYIKEPRA